jgi:MoaD family protein
MNEMKVNFYATLRQITGKKTVEVETGEAADSLTLRALLNRLFSAYPLLAGELVDEQGNLHGYVHVLINGRDAPYLQTGMETRLSSEDHVDIFPAVGGG